MAHLHLHSASKSFGEKVILDEISFSLTTGEIVGLFGRNGSGKSTLLQITFGTLKGKNVSIFINDEKIKPKKIIPSGLIAYLPQHPFLPNIKVRDIIPIYYSDQKLQDDVFYDKTIATFTHKKTSELSLGQLKYFEIILIGSGKHKFLLLDEPFSMLEPLQKIELQKFLIKQSQQKGILITDHYYEDVLKIATQNLVLINGKIEAVVNKDDLVKYGYLKNSK